MPSGISLDEPFQIPPFLKAMLEHEPSTEELVFGKPGGELRIGLVTKRVYKVGTDGRCELADDGDQELVSDDMIYYEALDPPRASPVLFDNDTAAFRSATDVVVQGHAQSYGRVIDRTTVALAIGEWRREINVYGNRRAEWSDGKLRFTSPEPFEILPIRYDRAYGGYDAWAIERFSNSAIEALQKARPDLPLGRQTAFHYPRNPTGKGFLIAADEQSVAGVEVPNLEFPFDPVTPERMAIGDVDRWLQAPLPACMDWTSPAWFPRVAYLGMAPLPEDPSRERVAEIEHGWAPEDLLRIPSVLQQPDALRSDFLQAASPGLSFPRIDLEQELVLENLHPKQPSWRVRLPHETPDVRLGLSGGQMTALAPHLNGIVMRPDVDEVLMIWCASAATPRIFTADQALGIPRETHWRTGASIG